MKTKTKYCPPGLIYSFDADDLVAGSPIWKTGSPVWKSRQRKPLLKLVVNNKRKGGPQS